MQNLTAYVEGRNEYASIYDEVWFGLRVLIEQPGEECCRTATKN